MDYSNDDNRIWSLPKQRRFDNALDVYYGDDTCSVPFCPFPAVSEGMCRGCLAEKYPLAPF